MTSTEKRAVSLPAEHAALVDELVASGSYASANAVLRALQERNAAVKHWLRDEVAPVYDAMEADPGRALSGDDVFGAIRARHAKSLSARS